MVVIWASSELTVEASGVDGATVPSSTPDRLAASWRASTRPGRAGELGLGQLGLRLELGLLGLEGLEDADLVAQVLAVGHGRVAVGPGLGGGLAGRPDQQHGGGGQHQQGADGGQDQLLAAGHGVTVPAGWKRPE